MNLQAHFVTKFCKYIKKLAKKSKDFDSFYAQCMAMKNVPITKSEYSRLISVASVEAKLQ